MRRRASLAAGEYPEMTPDRPSIPPRPGTVDVPLTQLQALMRQWPKGRQAASMNVFTAGHRNQPWVWQVTGLCFILGVLLAGSLQTVRSINRSGMPGGRRVGTGPALPAGIHNEKVAEQAEEINRLQKELTKLQNSLGTENGVRKALNDELQKVKIFSGLTEVKGPGVVVTLQDSKRATATTRSTTDVAIGIIHDFDLQAVIYELGQSGAEVTAVNNQRIVGRTSLRCVGPTILVNNVPLVPPYIITAIGDPDTLFGGLNLPAGVLEPMRRFDPAMVTVEKKTDIMIPAYTGSTEVKHAKPTVKTEDVKSSEEGQ